MTTRNARSITRLATLIGLGLLLASCATRYDIRSQAAANANLASYHTYAFMAKPGTDKDGYKTLATQTLERAVNREMYARGYTPAAVGSERRRAVTVVRTLAWIVARRSGAGCARGRRTQAAMLRTLRDDEHTALVKDRNAARRL